MEAVCFCITKKAIEKRLGICYNINKDAFRRLRLVAAAQKANFALGRFCIRIRIWKNG